MMANAIGKRLKKKMLLVNFPSLGDANSSGEIIKLLFREARIKKSILFFDECEVSQKEISGVPGITFSIDNTTHPCLLVSFCFPRPWQLLNQHTLERTGTFRRPLHYGHEQTAGSRRSHVPSRESCCGVQATRPHATRKDLEDITSAQPGIGG